MKNHLEYIYIYIYSTRSAICYIRSAYRNISDALGRLRSDEKYVSIYLKPHINILLSCYHVFLSEYNIFDLIPQSTSAQFISMTSYVELRNVLDSVKSSTNISELSPIHRNWLWIHLLKIYRQFIGTGCTRSVVKILKVFTTNHNVYEPVATTIEEHDEWLQFCQREVRKYQTGLIAEQVSHQR